MITIIKLNWWLIRSSWQTNDTVCLLSATLAFPVVWIVIICMMIWDKETIKQRLSEL